MHTTCTDRRYSCSLVLVVIDLTLIIASGEAQNKQKRDARAEAEAQTKREIKFPLIASILAEGIRQPDHWTLIGYQSLDDIGSPLLTWLQKTAASRRTL